MVTGSAAATAYRGWRALLALQRAAREAASAWAERLDACLPVIHHLELRVARSWRIDGLIGSHRDLHPTNLMRLPTGAFALVDWDAAGPVIPEHEVACFALVFAESPDRQHYDQSIVSAFVEVIAARVALSDSRGRVT